VARVEAGDVGGHIAEVVKVHLAQPVVVKYPQLESQVVVTEEREREL